MPITIFDQRSLLEIRQDLRLEQPTDFWRRRFFSATPFFSENQTIDFGKIVGTRAMAPFAQPSHMGKPIVKRQGMSVERFTPAYIKLLDAVRPEDATSLNPEEVLTGERMSMEQRFDMRTAEVVKQHTEAINRTLDYMTAKAIIDGAVTVKYDQEQGLPNPEVTISFGRSTSLTVAGANWSSAAADILGALSSVIALGRSAQFGMTATVFDFVMGTNVAPAVLKNTAILDLLKTDVRGGEATSLTRGIYVGVDPNNANAPAFLGTIGGNGVLVNLWVYSDQQLDDAGNAVQMLGTNDAVLIGGDPMGMMAYGAIYDIKANVAGVRTDIFQKMYETENPSAINVLTQSAPLPLVRRPNTTAKFTGITV